MTLKTLAAGLLIGTALSFGAVAALAQDAAAPAAPADAAPAAAPADAAPAPADAAPAAPADAAPADAAPAPADAAPAAPAAPAPIDPNAVVATVGTETITEADLSFAAEDLAQELQQVPAEQHRALLLSVLINMKLMAAAARTDGLDKEPLTARHIQYSTEQLLRRAYVSEKIANSLTEDSVKAAYDKYVADFVPVTEVHARHILVKTKEEADAVEADLKAGKPFEVEAMAKTTDPSGKENGGDLGFFSKGQMVPEFEAAAFALQPGQVSDPVQSQFGWHIIKVEESRETKPEDFNAKAQELSQQLMIKAFDETVATLRKDIKVDIPDAALAAQIAGQEAQQ